MKPNHAGLIVTLGLVFLCSMAVLPAADIGEDKLVLIRSANGDPLSPFQLQGLDVRLELRTGWLAVAGPGDVAGLSAAGCRVEILCSYDPDDQYLLVYGRNSRDQVELGRSGVLLPLDDGMSLLILEAGVEAGTVLPPRVRFTVLPSHSPAAPLPATGREASAAASRAVTPAITEMIRLVNQDNLHSYVQTLQDFVTRNATSSGCVAAGDYLGLFLTRLGLNPQFDPFTFPYGHSSRNVVATIPGSVTPSNRVVICGHYDSYRSSSAPGADDNASGTGAVMEAARIAVPYSFDYTVDFVCFSAEEWGLYGSEHYAAEASQSGQNIVAVLNLDMISYTDVTPEDLDLVCNNSSAWLADRFTAVTAEYVPALPCLKVVDASLTWSDHASFWNEGYSALCGIEDVADTNPYYHTPQDTIDKLNFGFYTQVARAVLAVAADIAGPVALAGDADGDWRITAADSDTFAAWLAGNSPTAVPSDFNRDGAQNLLDLVWLRLRAGQ